MNLQPPRIELQRAKDALEACDFVSPSTKGCYSSRIALWMHYCNIYCNNDDRVTEKRLADYVEWMVNSGSAERIRQGATHVQQVLRNQLQGVLCYWRIQNGPHSDKPDPRLGPIFIEKWQQIAMRYPRARQARRSEPIYGVTRVVGTSPTAHVEPKAQVPSPATRMSHSNGASNHALMPGAPIQLQHYPQNGAHARRIAPAPPTAVNGAAPHPAYSQVGPAHRPYSPGGSYDSRMVGHTAAPRTHPGTGARYGHDALPYRQQLAQAQPVAHVRTSPSMSNGTTLAPTPIVSRHTSVYSSKPSYPSSVQLQPPQQELERLGTQAAGCRASPAPSAATVPPRQMQSPTTQPISCPAAASEGARPSRAASLDVNSLPDVGTRSLMSSQGRQPAALEAPSLAGTLPEKIPSWDGEAAEASATTPEGHLLTSNEAIALSMGQIGATENAQIQIRAHLALGLATWAPAAARSALTLADLSMEDPAEFGVQSPLQAKQSSEQAPPPDHPLKAISLRLQPAASEAPAASRGSKAIALRHANPLLCPLGALAMWLFAMWSADGESKPDLSTTAWQAQHLFPAIAGNDFAELIADSVSAVTNDKIDGNQAMSDVGFFYADACGLVKPTTAGIKGLATVDAIDAAALRPGVLAILARINAGYGADVTEAVETPERFDVTPSPELLKEVFPGLKTMLLDAFRQDKNEDVLAAKRIVGVLRGLRAVLLQDVAFMMEVPALAEATKANPLFSDALFGSPEFASFREEMRKAVSETEAKAMDARCISSLEWVGERKEKSPEGSADRMTATAPILPTPSPTPALPAVGISESDGERKRVRDPGAMAAPDVQSEAADAISDGSTPAKRPRQAYNSPISFGEPGRIFGSASSPAMADAAPRGTPEGSTAPATDDAVKALDSLRTENQDLKAQVRRLEWVLSQHKAEVRAWMGKVEKSIRDVAVSMRRSVSPKESTPQYYPATSAPEHPGIPVSSSAHMRAQVPVHSAVQRQELLQQQKQQAQRNAYAHGQYRTPVPVSTNGVRQVPAPSVPHDTAVQYERQVAMHGSPTQRPHGQPGAVEYRTANPTAPSPRSQAYAARMAADPEYAGHRYPAQYAPGAPYSQQPGAYGQPDRTWYAGSREPSYTNAPPQMHPPPRGY
ncbi:hypothetical protein GGF46_000274 [Coemansia sp. RSA 552]|nr:hypothetical protein GGF46_000274 [Coemansia sp. RSA 552]